MFIFFLGPTWPDRYCLFRIKSENEMEIIYFLTFLSLKRLEKEKIKTNNLVF